MDSQRQKKYAKLIKEEVAAIFQREGKSLLGNSFITITDVKMSPDMGLAKIYLSFLIEKDKERMESIRENAWQFRKMLGKRIGKNVRKIPNINFYIDNTQEEVDKIEGLFKDIVIPEEKDNDNMDDLYPRKR